MRGAARLAGDVGDREVALDQAVGRVDQDERDVGPLGGGQRAHLAVVLDSLAVLRLRRRPAVSISRNRGRRGRTACRWRRGSSPAVGDDHPRTAEDGVHQRRLADVRAGPGWPRRSRRRRRRPGGRRPRPRPAARRSRRAARRCRGRGGPRRDRLAQPEPMQLERRRLVGGVVDLVGDDDHRPVRAAQDLRDLLVARSQAGAGVDHRGDDVGLLDRHPRLGGHLGLHRRVVADVDAARVDEDERPPAPLAHASLRSRVTPGCSSTTAWRDDVSRFTRVDLPAFGNPTTATTPTRCALVAHRACSYRVRISAMSSSAVSR